MTDDRASRADSINEYPASLAEAEAALDRIVNEGTAGRTGRNSRFLVERILGQAAEIGEVDAGRVESFIRQRLLPLCLKSPGADASDRGRALRMRELLRDWLESLPESVLHRVRSAVTRDIIERLHAEPQLETLYCLTAIGHRSNEVLRSLRWACGHDNEFGDEALRLLVGLQPALDHRQWAAGLLRERIERRPTDTLLNAAALMHEAFGPDRLAEATLRVPPSWHSFARFLRIADEVPGDLPLQQEVWTAMVRVATQIENGWAELLFNGGIVERCNSPRPVADLMAHLAEIKLLGDVHVWRLAERLQESITPLQVAGWKEVSGCAALEHLRPYVERATEQRGPSTTEPFHMKTLAIEMLLCGGSPLPTELLQTTLGVEAGHHVRHNLMEQLAVLSLPHLSHAAARDLTPVDFAGGKHEPEIIAFLGAARLVASAEGVQSLKLLLSASGTVDGHPLREPVESAANLAEWLVRRGEGATVLPLLESAARLIDRPMAQSTAVRALRFLAERSQLIETHVDLLRALSADTTLRSYVRSDALAALAAVAKLHAESAPTRTLDSLLALLCAADQEVRGAAARAAIWVGATERVRSQIEAIAFPQGRADGWASNATPEAAMLIGQLAGTDPNRYAEEAAALIERHELSISDNALWGFQSAPARARAPSVISDAIVRRLRRDESESFANPSLFAVLAELDPARLLKEGWPNSWDRWMADSRQALADAIPGAWAKMPEGERSASALRLLEELLGDGVFAVRRSAARSLASIDAGHLTRWCDERAAGGSIGLRQRAAEAASWLPIETAGRMDNGILRGLERDSELTVRRAAQRGAGDARRRRWASSLLSEVQRRREDGNAWVLASYAAGKALARVGDDSDIETLRNLAANVEAPPNVRFWFDRILKELEKQWKETTKNWPDPWSPWRGAIENTEGKLEIGGSVYPVRVSLWHRRARQPEGVSYWGGKARMIQEEGLETVFKLIHADRAQLHIPGRPLGEAVIAEVSDGFVTLSGTGPYPSASAGRSPENSTNDAAIIPPPNA